MRDDGPVSAPSPESRARREPNRWRAGSARVTRDRPFLPGLRHVTLIAEGTLIRMCSQASGGSLVARRSAAGRVRGRYAAASRLATRIRSAAIASWATARADSTAERRCSTLGGGD